MARQFTTSALPSTRDAAPKSRQVRAGRAAPAPLPRTRRLPPRARLRRRWAVRTRLRVNVGEPPPRPEAIRCRYRDPALLPSVLCHETPHTVAGSSGAVPARTTQCNEANRSHRGFTFALGTVRCRVRQRGMPVTGITAFCLAARGAME